MLQAILRQLAQPARDARDMPQRIALCEQALALVSRQTNAPLWAALQVELANSLAQNPLGSRADNLERAIEGYTLALEVYTRQAFPEQWATTHNNLANAYNNRIMGSRADNLERAIEGYTLALEVYTRQAFPVEQRGTLKNLLNLYFKERRWVEAYQTGQHVLDIGKDIFIAAQSDAGRLDSLRETGAVYAQLAYSAVQLGHDATALTTLEAGKARLLAEAQALGDMNLTALAASERADMQAARERLRELEYESRLPSDHPARRPDAILRDDRAAAWTVLRTLINTLQAKYPEFMTEDLPAAEMIDLIPPEGALVAPLFTSQGSLVFIVPNGTTEITAEHILRLDAFTLADLQTISRGTLEDRGWLAHYISYRAGRTSLAELREGMRMVTHRLWDAVVAPIHARLQALGVQHVLLMPHGEMALLPFHAAWRAVDGQPRYLIDDYTITYTPSMVSLASAKRRTRQGQGALVAGVSQYVKLSSLPNVLDEVDTVAALLKTTPLVDAQVTSTAVKDKVRGQAIVHLACHGGFGWGGDVFGSALYLAHDEALSLADIIAHVDTTAARLVVLSACETGITDITTVPDEFVGLAAGFMQAGAGAVISSLWTVNDHSTALLMERMYALMHDPQQPLPPAQALRQAQFWLRKATINELSEHYQTYLVPRLGPNQALAAFVDINRRGVSDDCPYADPYFWAAFTYSGG